jgi:hypothetical protein
MRLLLTKSQSSDASILRVALDVLDALEATTFVRLLSDVPLAHSSSRLALDLEPGSAQSRIRPVISTA